MKSVIVIIVLYIGLFWYGSSIDTPKVSKPSIADQRKDSSLSFNDNHFSIFNEQGEKSADIKCKKAIIQPGQQQFFESIQVHFFKTTRLNNKNSQNIKLPKNIKEDLYLDASKGTYESENKTFVLEGDVEVTIGDNSYFKSAKATLVDQKKLHFPSSVFLQRDDNIYTGKDAHFNLETHQAKILKDIHCLFKIRKSALSKDTDKPKLTELTSAGPLVFDEIKRKINLKNKTIIENDELKIECESANLFLNKNNELERIESTGLVHILVKKNNITATAPKASINLETNIFTLTEDRGVKPFIIINEYKQTASYIIFDNNAETLKAGPYVESVKIKKSK